jgi:hypothetical protein
MRVMIEINEVKVESHLVIDGDHTDVCHTVQRRNIVELCVSPFVRRIGNLVPLRHPY